MLDVAKLELAAAVAEIDDVAGRAGRGDRGDLVERKLALGEDVQHLASDIAGRADHDHPVTHVPAPLGKVRAPYRKPRVKAIWRRGRGGQDEAKARGAAGAGAARRGDGDEIMAADGAGASGGAARTLRPGAGGGAAGAGARRPAAASRRQRGGRFG